MIQMALVKMFEKFTVEELAHSMGELQEASAAPPVVDQEKNEQDKSLPPPISNGLPQNHAPVLKLIPRNFMNSEEVFYWSCVSQYLYKKGLQGLEGLEKIIPTLSEFCDYIMR